MIFNLSRDVSISYNKKSVCRLKVENSNLNNFPIAYIGENSYLVSSRVNTIFDSLIPSIKEKYKYDFIRFGYNLHIGKYSSLAHNIDFIINLDHEFLNIYQGSVFEESKGPINKKNPIQRKGQVLIQNDVWVGMNVTIMGGVTIHNGAVVAAGSVVTKDVAPYSIVGGNPARHIKYRFPKDIIEKLLVTQWWFWDKLKIEAAFKKYDNDINSFLGEYFEDAMKNKEKTENYELDIPNCEKTFLFFSDTKEIFSTYKQVIMGFVDFFEEDETAQLLIFMKKIEQENMNRITEVLEKLDGQCNIYIHCQKKDEDELAIFKYANYYISNRTEDVNLHSCYADMFGLKKISGVNIPLISSGKL